MQKSMNFDDEEINMFVETNIVVLAEERQAEHKFTISGSGCNEAVMWLTEDQCDDLVDLLSNRNK